MSKNSITILTGNTYPVRSEIAAIPGAHWDAQRKAWVITPGTMAERARQSSAIYALKKKGVVAKEY